MESSVTPNTDVARQVTEAWMEGWNNKDADSLVGLIAGDLVYEDPSWPDVMRTADDVRAFTSACWRAMPDMSFTEPYGLFPSEDGTRAVAPWHMTATFSGPMDPPGFAPTGDRIEVDGFDLFEFRDGKISRLSTVFDMMALARDVGLLPARGSRAEQAGVKLQRLMSKRRRR
jgi:steroid delta-isomerase-like uncharacterized protein